MPTLALEGAVKRSDGTNTVDQILLTQSGAVDEDSFNTMKLGPSGSGSVAFGLLVTASFVVIKSDRQLSVVLTAPGPSVLPAIKARNLHLENTEIIGISLTNLDAVDPAVIRVGLGGA